eukprot:m.121000 g.121000  ORF g.121000 m.121000 type:complete len:202 (-) comp21871_c0_seq1:453-1058(-)
MDSHPAAAGDKAEALRCCPQPDPIRGPPMLGDLRATRRPASELVANGECAAAVARSVPSSHPKLVPELRVSNIHVSRTFYTELLHAQVLYGRPDDGFLYLALPGGAEIMLDSSDSWATAEATRPFGRGINFQIEVPDVTAVHDLLVQAGCALFRPLEAAWYNRGDHYVGNHQFLVQDPDGYLLRFFSDLGEKKKDSSSVEL